MLRFILPKHSEGWPLKINPYLRSLHRQALASSNVERHTGPTPTINKEFDRSECLHLRIRGHTILLAIAPVLTTHNIRGIERSHRLEEQRLLIANSIRVFTGGSIHREEGDQLQQMILHHIADRTGLFVKFPSTRHTKILSHRDLHTLDVIPVPDRIEKRVREAEIEYILYWFLSKIMINPKDS